MENCTVLDDLTYPGGEVGCHRTAIRTEPIVVVAKVMYDGSNQY